MSIALVLATLVLPALGLLLAPPPGASTSLAPPLPLARTAARFGHASIKLEDTAVAENGEDEVAAGGGSILNNNNIPRGSPFAEFYTGKDGASPTRPRRRVSVARRAKGLASQMVGVAIGVALTMGAITANAALENMLPTLTDVPAVAREVESATASTGLASGPVLAAARARGGRQSQQGKQQQLLQRGTTPLVTSAKLLRAEDVPRPWPGKFRKEGGRITDSANLLTSDESHQHITRTIRFAEAETGTEMFVVTLPSIGRQSPKKFATMLFNEWKVGSARRNNGVLVLVVQDQRRIQIEVGARAAKQFSNSWTDSMIENRVLPSFKAGQFSRGLERCVDACAARLFVSNAQIDAANRNALLQMGAYALVFAFFMMTGIRPPAGRGNM